MVTENVTISFVENGARVVKRKIDEIGQAANNATRGIFLLKRALFVLGGAGVVNSLVKMTDALTNMENKLRLTSTSTANLEAVQDALFASANRSRSAVEATADVYSRIALSARGLGASQQQIIAVTETLQKAAIISGASAQEANAALVQLGQGLASDRLSGDELRSVLEQLPYVADIIVDYLNKTGQFGTVTRGTLRQLGKEGKLTADIVFKAIEAAQSGVDQLFAQTNPTIEQAFNVARNNLLKFIDDFDDATGASAALAKAIIVISQNLDIVVGVLGLVAAGFALSFGAALLGRINAYADGFTRAGADLARYAAIQVDSANKQVAATSATLNDTRARLQNTTTRQAQIGATLRNAQAEYAEAEAQFVGGRARSAATGQFIAMQGARDRLTAATIRLTAAERANNIATGRSAALSAEVTAAETAQAAARTRLGAATAAQGGFVARLAGTFPLLTGVIRGAAGAIGIFSAALLANPIGLVIAAITVLLILFFTLGDKIKVTADGVVSFKDATVAAFQLLFEALAPFVGPVWDAISNALAATRDFIVDAAGVISTAFFNAVENIIDAFTFIPRVVTGVVAGIIAAFQALPGQAAAVATGIANALIGGFEAFANGAIKAINTVIRALNALLSFVGAEKAADLFGFSGQLSELSEVTLPRFTGAAADAGVEAGDAFINGFNKVYEGGKIANIGTGIANALAPVGDAIIDRARQNIANEPKKGKLEDLAGTNPGGPGAGAGGGGGAGGANEKSFAQELAEIQQKIELEKQYGLQKEINNQILSVEKSLKRELSATEKDQVTSAVQLLEISKAYGSILEEIRGPQEALQFGQAALNQLFQEGAISLDSYNSKLRELQINADKAANTIGGGFRAAIAGAIQSASQLGDALGNWVVGAANSAADAIVEFAKTGEFNVRQFFNDLFAQLLKLAAQQILLRLLGSVLGIPGGGFGGGGGGLGFATGGSILPSGPGSTDSQVVAFKKRPDERVDILTPGQQQHQKDQMKNGDGTSGGGSSTVQVNPKIVNVLDPGIVGQFLNTPEGEAVIVNTIQKTGILDRGRY